MNKTEERIKEGISSTPLLFVLFILLVLTSNFWAYAGIEFVKDYFNNGGPLSLKEWIAGAVTLTTLLAGITYVFGVPFKRISSA